MQPEAEGEGSPTAEGEPTTDDMATEAALPPTAERWGSSTDG